MPSSVESRNWSETKRVCCCNSISYYKDDRTHEYEMVWNVASMGQKKYLYVVSVALEEIQRPDADGGKKLKWILKNWVGWNELDIHLAQERNKRSAVVNKLMNIRATYNATNFLAKWANLSFSRRIMLHAVSHVFSETLLEHVALPRF